MKAVPKPIVDYSLPVVALVGRPNVGKSTMFNRLTSSHFAIVEDQPGVTRDRRYGNCEYDGRQFRVVDTGGIDFTAEGSIAVGMRRQAEMAIAEADVVLLIVDGQHGLLPDDREIFVKLRRAGKKILLVANKIDGPRHESHVNDMYELGCREIFGVSAAHGRGMPDLLDAILLALPVEEEEAQHVEPPLADFEHDDTALSEDALAAIEQAESAHEEDDGPGDEGPDTVSEADLSKDVIRIALVGRPNAGKSSLVNTLCGEERMLVDSTPGTTRDPIDTPILHGGQRFSLIDTAGIRRRVRVHEPSDRIAMTMAERAIERADVAVLVIDASEGIGEMDARIAGLVADAGRVLLIALNKRDLVPAARMKEIEAELDRKLQFVPWAHRMWCSAHTQKGVLKILDEATRCYRSFASRVKTSALNRFFAGIVEKHPPPLFQGKPIRLYYITQAQTRPPTFVVSVNYTEGMHFSYRRYLQNQLRETFGFVGTPIRLLARAKTK
ncbi:MAG: ribosome biogenesis GTPase Der [Myxococcales bacterium]|nr:ribosome biogenesis GTPase Der [Myxococcales bacterium]